MKCVYKLILLFGTFLPCISAGNVKFFRKDYTYSEKFDAFYKLHWDLHGLSWNAAFKACDDEGATFFYPKWEGEWTLVKNLTESLPEAPNVTEIFVGLHDKFGVGEFVTVDGHPTPSPIVVDETELTSDLPGGNCVLMNFNTGSYRVGPCLNHRHAPMPFVCKKVDESSCPTVDRGYKYIKASNKCYKINRRQTTWDDAMRTCYMEGGVLAILENSMEADELFKLLRRDSVPHDPTPFLLALFAPYHVGIRRIQPQDTLYSVRGKKFDDLYQRPMRNRNTDEDDAEGSGACGIIRVDNSYIFTYSDNCDQMLPFICEMEAST